MWKTLRDWNSSPNGYYLGCRRKHHLEEDWTGAVIACFNANLNSPAQLPQLLKQLFDCLPWLKFATPRLG